MLANRISAAENVAKCPPHAHLIGAGGAGMRALADVLLGQGWHVTGSDLSSGSGRAYALAGHRAEHVSPQADLVIYSAAISRDNCERKAAERLGIRTLSYPEMLGELSRTRTCLAVAGTHGKSTVTAMAAAALLASGLDPTVVGGAAPCGATSGGRAGRGAHFLVEACEYRAHFLHLHAQVAVLLGIEPDHFDCFPTFAQQRAAFWQFAEQTAAGGLLLAHAACPTTLEIVRKLDARHETFALEAAADWQASEITAFGGRHEFDLRYRGKNLGRLRLQVPGRHNVINALAAVALAQHAGAKLPEILGSLQEFRGVERRFEQKELAKRIRWINDYAHHPTEVAAALATVRQVAPQARVWCVFQPHQASRTERLWEGFAQSLQNADKIAIADIFHAREKPRRSGEVTAANLAAELRRRGCDVLDGHQPAYIKSWLAHAIAHRELTPNDIMITMGAGDIESIGYELSHWIGKFRTAG